MTEAEEVPRVLTDDQQMVSEPPPTFMKLTLRHNPDLGEARSLDLLDSLRKQAV